MILRLVFGAPAPGASAIFAREIRLKAETAFSASNLGTRLDRNCTLPRGHGMR